MKNYEDDVVCDLADTYHIFNYRQYDPFYIATLVEGLGHNSRVITKISGLDVPLNEIISAMCADALNILVWTKTKDATKGKNKPNSILNALLTPKEESDIVSFDSGEDFEKAKQKILKGGG